MLAKQSHGGARLGDGSIGAARYGESRQRIARLAAQPKRKQRKCLKCQTPFMSSGPENHVCGSCKAGPAFQGGVIDVGTNCGTKIGVRRA